MGRITGDFSCSFARIISLLPFVKRKGIYGATIHPEIWPTYLWRDHFVESDEYGSVDEKDQLEMAVEWKGGFQEK